MLAFFMGPIGRWLIIALVVAASYGAAYLKGRSAGYDKRDAQAQEEAKERDRQAQAIVAQHISRMQAYAKELDSKLAAANAQTRELETKLKGTYAQLVETRRLYVTAQDDAKCGAIPAGFLRLHRSATTGVDPSTVPPSAASGAGSGPPAAVYLSDVAAADVANLGLHKRCLTALGAWEKWYTAAQSTYDKHLTEGTIR